MNVYIMIGNRISKEDEKNNEEPLSRYFVINVTRILKLYYFLIYYITLLAYILSKCPKK